MLWQVELEHNPVVQPPEEVLVVECFVRCRLWPIGLHSIAVEAWVCWYGSVACLSSWSMSTERSLCVLDRSLFVRLRAVPYEGRETHR